MKRVVVLLCMALICSLTFAAGTKEAKKTSFKDPNTPRSSTVTSYPIDGLGWAVTSNVKASKKYTLAIVVKNTSNPWMNANGAGFKAAGEAMGFEALVYAPAKADSVEEQSRIIDDLIQRGVDGIVVHPADSNGIVPAVERAWDAGIPCIIEGTAANTQKIFGWYGTKYYDQGKMIAQYVADTLKGKGNVIYLPGPPQAQNAIERTQAIHDVFAKYPGIKIIAEQPSNFSRADGLQVTENLLQKFKESEIDCIIGSNDEAAMGAIKAMQGAGYKVGLQNGGIMTAGFDCNKDASYAIQTGLLDVSVNPDPPSLGWLGAAYLVQYLNDETLPPSCYIPYPDLEKTKGVIVDKTNINYYIENIAWWKIPTGK